MPKPFKRRGRPHPSRHIDPRPPGGLPSATIILITGTDEGGDPVGRPDKWDRDAGQPPRIRMRPEPSGHPALAPGDRVLAKLRPTSHNRYEGRTIHRISEAPSRILGVFRAGHPDGRLSPTDRRAKAEWVIPRGQEDGAETGEIVLAEALPHHRLGLKPAKVVERLGAMGDARSISLIAIHTAGIPTEFSPAAETEAGHARAVRASRREDISDVPLVTIDGADARDFDDAVFAEQTDTGYRLIVAIADVAWYVRPASGLDHDARERGNSVYFPDRVVPMLPEALSNGWCSLRPNEDRGCLFVEMHIDRQGRKRGHRFGRGMMRSAARLTYEQAQADADAHPALFGAYRALLDARTGRGTLDLDLPEREIVLAPDGSVRNVVPRPRLDSHRLIEEFMVLANVAAAEELERLGQPVMYRVHPPPSEEKLTALRGFLRSIGVSLPPGSQVHPRDLDRVLRKVAGTPNAQVVNEVMLRSQAQASYAPDNVGHFGLALSRYAHFTSPIRRYADLLVHRALITGLKLGLGGLGEGDAARMEATAEHITATERRAALAERDAGDRYLAAFMADKTGMQFDARITGVTRFGLFITLPDSGATGIVPMRALPDDYWQLDEMEQTLTGRHSRQVFRLSERVSARLVEANPVTGGLVFALVVAGQSGRRPHRR